METAVLDVSVSAAVFFITRAGRGTEGGRAASTLLLHGPVGGQKAAGPPLPCYYTGRSGGRRRRGRLYHVSKDCFKKLFQRQRELNRGGDGPYVN